MSSKNLDYDLIFYSISKEKVIIKDFEKIDAIMSLLTDAGISGKRSFHLNFDGYDDDIREIYCIPEIREFVSNLFKKYPNIFYFLHKDIVKVFLLCMTEIKDTGFNRLLGKVSIEINPKDKAVKDIIKATMAYGIFVKDCDIVETLKDIVDLTK